MKTEPILIIVGALGGLATAAMALVTAFGIDVTKAQSDAILGVVAVIVSLVTAFAARSQVDSPLTVQKKVTDAARPKHVPAAKGGP